MFLELLMETKGDKVVKHFAMQLHDGSKSTNCVRMMNSHAQTEENKWASEY